MVSSLRCSICLFVLCSSLFAPSSAAPITQSEPTITLVAVGDILLDRGVARKIQQHGIAYPFALVESILAGADIAFGNLEGPLSNKCDQARKRYRFRGKPRYATSLVNAGFDVLSLANNHSADCGQVGLIETMRNLKAAGIRWCGAGNTREEAASVTLLEIEGIKIGFVAFSEYSPDNSPSLRGRAVIADAFEESVKSSVIAARRQADVVIASFHWGVEYSSRPRDKEFKLARVAVEAGADLVLGHHPHLLQGIQTVMTRNAHGVRRSLIAFSLGNFVFDSPTAWDKRMNESVILRCTFNKSGLVAFEAVPVVIDAYRPRVATELEANRISARLENLSVELNAK